MWRHIGIVLFTSPNFLRKKSFSPPLYFFFLSHSLKYISESENHFMYSLYASYADEHIRVIWTSSIDNILTFKSWILNCLVKKDVAPNHFRKSPPPFFSRKSLRPLYFKKTKTKRIPKMVIGMSQGQPHNVAIRQNGHILFTRSYRNRNFWLKKIKLNFPKPRTKPIWSSIGIFRCTIAP